MSILIKFQSVWVFNSLLSLVLCVSFFVLAFIRLILRRPFTREKDLLFSCVPAATDYLVLFFVNLRGSINSCLHFSKVG